MYLFVAPLAASYQPTLFHAVTFHLNSSQTYPAAVNAKIPALT